MLQINGIIERQPTQGDIKKRERGIGFALPIVCIAEAAAWCAILIVGVAPIVFCIGQQRPLVGQPRTQAQLAKGCLFCQSFMVLVGVVMYNSRQAPMIVVIVELRRKGVVIIGLPIKVQLTTSCIHTAVGAVLTCGECNILKAKRIVVVGMEEITESSKQEPTPIPSQKGREIKS